MSRTSRLAVVFVGMLLVAGAVALAAPRPRLKLATLAPKGTSFEKVLLAMREQWRNAPGGGAELVIYTDGSMGGEADMVRRMRAGQLQAGMLTVSGLCEIDESVAALQNLPMFFRSLDELEYVMEKLRPTFEKRFEQKGFKVLFWSDAGWIYFFSKKPARVPDDYKKMKLFSWAGDPVTVELWKANGYQPVPLEITDTLPGLQTGLIDAVCTAPSYALAGQVYNPAPHMLDLKWVPLVGGTVITLKTWNTLPEATREAMLKSAQEAGRQIRTISRAESVDSIEAMKKRGLKVQPVGPEDLAVWQKTVTHVYPTLRGKIVPADMYDEVHRLVAEYRAAHRAEKP